MSGRHLILTMLLFLGAGTGEASAQYHLWESPNEIDGMALLNVVSMHDMQGNRWVFQAAPGYFSVTNRYEQVNKPAGVCAPGACSGDANVTFHGYSGALAVKRELTPHWGLSLSGVVARQRGQLGFGGVTGDISGLAPPAANSNTPGGAGFAGGYWSGIYSHSVQLTATWDYFSDPDKFRMPISFGPAYIMQGWQFHNSFKNPNNGAAQMESVDFSRASLGWFANISFDIPATRYFKIMPGILAQSGIGNWDSSYNYVVSQNGKAQSFPAGLTYSNSVVLPYFSFMYRPWDLMFTYPINLTGGGSAFANFSITLTKKFDGRNKPI